MGSVLGEETKERGTGELAFQKESPDGDPGTIRSLSLGISVSFLGGIGQGGRT